MIEPRMTDAEIRELDKSPRSRMSHSHSEVCEFFGVPSCAPRIDWLPYAVQATVIEVYVNGTRKAVYGGGMRCGQCDYGVDMKPGRPGVHGPHGQTTAADRLRCPKCGYAGTDASRESPGSCG